VTRLRRVEEILARAERDEAVTLSGRFGDARVAYLDTERTLE
jgi:hypothetical protein